MDTAYLDSLVLSDDVRRQIDAEAQAIRTNNIQSIKLRICNGYHLQQLKKLIGHGGWLSWLLESNLGYASARTVERDMALAEALYARLDEIDALDERTNLTALFELTRAGAPGDALATALHLMAGGQRVNGRDAQRLTYICEAVPALAEKVRAGELTLADAEAVAQRLDEINAPAAVVALVVDAGVRAPAMVDALAVMHSEQPARFADVASSRAVYNPVAQVEVPLAQASGADGMTAVEYEDAERAARQMAYLRAWRDKKQERVGMVQGRPGDVLRELQTLLAGDGEYRVYVYAAEREPAQSKI